MNTTYRITLDAEKISLDHISIKAIIRGFLPTSVHVNPHANTADTELSKCRDYVVDFVDAEYARRFAQVMSMASTSPVKVETVAA